MKILIQRVSRGSVTIEDNVHGAIDRGIVALVGVREGDSPEDARKLAEKTLKMRIFPDDDDKMNRSVADIGGSILIISQFTLYADTRKGTRPGFAKAASPDTAVPCYEAYIDSCERILGKDSVATGVFGAMMSVEIINDGPVTVELHTDHG